MYLRGSEVKARKGTDVLAQTRRPYFNRTYQHFMSHKHAPSTGEAVYPGVTRRGNLTYFAHPLFTQYQHNAPRWCRTLLHNVLKDLLPQALVTHSGPSTLQISLNQKGTSYVLHLLHYLPLRRSSTIDVIEDVIALHNLHLSLALPQDQRVVAVTRVPKGEGLEWKVNNGRVDLDLPELVGHQMIEVRFESWG